MNMPLYEHHLLSNISSYITLLSFINFTYQHIFNLCYGTLVKTERYVKPFVLFLCIGSVC